MTNGMGGPCDSGENVAVVGWPMDDVLKTLVIAAAKGSNINSNESILGVGNCHWYY